MKVQVFGTEFFEDVRDLADEDRQGVQPAGSTAPALVWDDRAGAHVDVLSIEKKWNVEWLPVATLRKGALRTSHKGRGAHAVIVPKPLRGSLHDRGESYETLANVGRASDE